MNELTIGKHYSRADRVRLWCRRDWRQWLRAKAGTPYAGSYWYSFGEACDIDGDVLTSVRRLVPKDDLDAMQPTHVVVVLAAGSWLYLPLDGQRRRLPRADLGTSTPAQAANELAVRVLGTGVAEVEAVGLALVLADEDQSEQRWLVCHVPCDESRQPAADRSRWLTSEGASDVHLIDRSILREVTAWHVLRPSRGCGKW